LTKTIPLDSHPDKVQAWCDAHPAYPEFKIRSEKILKEQADLEGITVEELKKKINKSLNGIS
jgi:hypothetical protein